MRLLADLHLHSPFSRATSAAISPQSLAAAARRKGLDLLGSGDACHPGWLEILERELLPAEPGFYRLRAEARGPEPSVPGPDPEGFGGLPGEAPAPGGPRFVLSAELSTLYRAGGRGRRVHHLILLPSFRAARLLGRSLLPFGNLASDGRPSLKLDSRDLLELALEAGAILIPAHIWTPWYAVLGASSGFDSIEDCYRDLSPRVGALETGLSSDPPMNRALSALDRFALVSNSDAHSLERLGREATILELEPGFAGLREALSGREGGPGGRVAGTLELFPEAGKYHWDGHRNCGISLPPEAAAARGGLCPACGRPLTKGVLHRVLELADRPIEAGPASKRPGAGGWAPFQPSLPLDSLLAALLGLGESSKRVRELGASLAAAAGSEYALLFRLEPERAGALFEARAKREGGAFAEALRSLRSGRLAFEPGADGRYGRIRLLGPEGAEAP